MGKFVHQRKLASYALLIWFVASLSWMHLHYCFDGGEPPLSIHFNALDISDVEHFTSDTEHIDVDTNPVQKSVIKVFNLDLPFIALAFFILFVWPIVRGQRFIFVKSLSVRLTLTWLRPPLRAPPKSSH
ncbi:hypothetical protein JYB87_00635 [Shewanella avicenniae]|uniref:Uncharacterized protein n=1 Tax=Shewanella avicenniae TaxID=2814294 RepID=A0ABX7QQQ5_9GAMM|nr:hypothetical protein [Shewanella avicenniae]QSX33796.1 hypothetical protein JYB87_00635 [Shewanella avicenniae]